VGVDQVPDVITVEYVQRVINALDKALGDATRMLYANKVPTMEWRNRLMAIFDGKAFDLEEQAFGRDAAHEFEHFRNPPGDPSTTVLRVHDSSPTCIVMSVRRDFGPFFSTPVPPDQLHGLMVLQQKQPTRDPGHVNGTTWAITVDGDAKPGADLEHGCHLKA
jgi:hypothetical protein